MNRIRDLRKELELSQAQLAAKFNLSQQTISSYENSTREPDTETLKQLAVFFDVSLDYLLGLSDIKKFQSTVPAGPCSHPALDTTALPPEAVQQIQEYEAFIKQKYAPKHKRKSK